MSSPTCRHVFCSFLAEFGNNAPTSDRIQLDTLQRISGNCASNGRVARRGWLVLLLAVAPGACHSPSTPVATTPQSLTAASTCGAEGHLSASLFGAVAGQISWTDAELDCTGMPRPNGEGARLRFAGSQGDNRIAIIIAMPELRRGAKGVEFASNVTLIEEGSGRFFSTIDLDNCWSDITALESIDNSEHLFAIGGALYCVMPLAEVNGASSVSIAELEFQGILDWNAS